MYESIFSSNMADFSQFKMAAVKILRLSRNDLQILRLSLFYVHDTCMYTFLIGFRLDLVGYRVVLVGYRQS